MMTSDRIIVRSPKEIMRVYNVDFDTAERYCDLRDEGYSTYAAKVMSGISDPDECTSAEREH